MTYDYFYRRDNKFTEKKVFLSDNQSSAATLYECGYNSNIINLKECFYNTKFVNCKNWFDPNDNISIINKDEDRNYIIYGGKRYDEIGFEYYLYNSVNNSYQKQVLNNHVIDDCLYNYTDFISENEIRNPEGEFKWYNHDLLQDLSYYGNIMKDSTRPFENITNMGSDTIQKTYCCLPPDFLYVCRETTELDSIFANSNIIGVIPRNLTNNIKKKSIPNIFRNVNIMPNLEYYYDKNGSLNSSILDEISDIVEIDGDSDTPIISDEYCVVFRDEYGKLKKRKPVSSDRNLGQFVYVPSNFTTSTSITNMFNFRYNLPKHWEMPGKFVDKNGITIESYKSTHDLNNAINNGDFNPNELLQYHSQYYFITDKCVKWDNVYDSKSVFISSIQDIDFGNKNTIGKTRDYYNGNTEVDINGKYTWTVDQKISQQSSWSKETIKSIHIDLNRCGKKNEYNMIEDYGCPVIIKNRIIHLDNFVSGILTVFLNGRVFDDSFVVNQLTTSNHKNSPSSSVIDYFGCGKNIILPKFNGSPLDDELVFIPIDGEFDYYDFMVDCDSVSMNNYYKYFAEGKIKNNLFKTDYNKYTFKSVVN